MRAINRTAQEIMDKLTRDIGPGCRHRKIDNAGGVFMAVVVEDIGGAQLGQAIGTLFSVAHYYTQNGDPMRDPEMVFFRGPGGKYFPTMFQQDSAGIYQECVGWAGEKIITYFPELQDDQVEFANMWMKNICEQQEL